MSSTAAHLEKPSVLVVSPSAYPLGGVATWLDGLVHGLRARGWNLRVALLSGRHHDVDRYLERHPLDPVLRIENRSGSSEGRIRALARTIEASGAELVLSVNVGDIENAVARLRCDAASGPRLVTTQHGLQRDFFEHLRERANIVDGVVATNRLSVELAHVAAGVERERVAYAPYGVELREAKRSAPSATPRVLWVGRIEDRQKRASDLLGIALELERRGSELTLTVAGSGPEEARLRAELAAGAAGRHVRFLGDRSRASLFEEVYPESDVLLVTSSWETGPIVAWEALVAGLAVVSSAFVGSGREGALRHGETTLLFPVGDHGAAVDCLEKLRNPELRARLAARGLEEVEKRYASTVSLDAWEDAIARLARLSPRPAPSRGSTSRPSGRLDRIFGSGGAESLREGLGIRHSQARPGDEWPHALIRRGNDGDFERMASELDRRSPGDDRAN